MKSRRNTLCILGLTCLLASGAWAQTPSDADQKHLQAMMDAARKDLKTEKQGIMDQAMGLDADGKAKFWAVYKNYQKELDTIWDARLASVKTYAQTYDTMTDGGADQLAASGLKNETSLTALKQKYYGQFKAAVGAKAAARWLQTETALNSLATLQLLSQLPLIQ
jgi:hypothetical protein